eukprot:TCONS_00032206-protein
MIKEKTKKGEATPSWFVETARTLESNGDVCAAKSWLLTGKTLFPKDFNIQYEEFMMEKSAGRIQKCARLFYDMLNIFPSQKTLWEELARIFHSQDGSRTQNNDTIFLKEMFDSLPMTHQKELLLKYANHHSDLIDKCRISLLVLKRFKGAVKDQAIKLIAKLKAAEEQESPNTPLNIYRKMIVCDILPLILKSPDTNIAKETPKHKGKINISEDQMLEYLNMMIELYIACIVNKNNFTSIDTSTLDLDDTTSSWIAIHENTVQFATKFNWSNYLKFKDKIDPTKNKPLRSRLKTLSNAKENKHPLAIFYGLLQLHLLAVLEYCSSVVHKTNQSEERDFVLLEHISSTSNSVTKTHSVIKTPKKKRKLDEASGYSSDHQSSSDDISVVVHPGLLGKVNENLGECLQVAIDAQLLLEANYYQEFSHIKEQWKTSQWNWLNTFKVDSLLYQGKFRKIIDKLDHVRELNPLKGELRHLCALYCSGQRKAACEKGLDVISTIPITAFENNTPQDEPKHNLKSEGRNLVLITTNPHDILNYVVQIIFATLKNGLYTEGVRRNMTIGHLIVLSQLSWTKHEEFFLHLLKLIQAQDEKSFTYELFFNYVIQIDILEEFAYLHSIDSIALTLSPPDENAAKRTVTRGVNKSVEGGFRSSIVRQVQLSHDSVHALIANFLKNERRAIMEAIL